MFPPCRARRRGLLGGGIGLGGRSGARSPGVLRRGASRTHDRRRDGLIVQGHVDRRGRQHLGQHGGRRHVAGVIGISPGHRRARRIGRVRRVRRASGGRASALTTAAAPRALLGLQRGAEGLIAVVGVESTSRGLVVPVLAAAGAAHRPQDARGQVVPGLPLLLVGDGAALRELLAQVRDGTTGDHQDGERDEQDEQDDGRHGGEEHCQGVADDPAEHPPGLLQRRHALRQGGVAGDHLDNARHARQHAEYADADARVHRTQAADPQHGHAQRSEEEWDDDT